MSDDQRQAASLKIGISNYVATAALAVLAVAAALFTFISQSFVPVWWFYPFIGAAAVVLVISIFLGGEGADANVALLAEGQWNNSRTWQFDWQAGLTLLGLVLLLAATAIGATSAARVGEPVRLKRLEEQVVRLQRSVDGLDHNTYWGRGANRSERHWRK